MSIPVKGQADHLELDDWNAICSVCGRKYKASQMVRQPDGVGTPWGGGTYVCKRDYRPRQPQDFVRGIPDKMAPPWVQPWPNDGAFQRMPVINITEDTDELIVFINVGTPSPTSARLVLVIASNVTLSFLQLVETTDAPSATVYLAEEVIINVSSDATLGLVENEDEIPIEIHYFVGGGRSIGLRFLQQPTTVGANSTISPAVTVALVDEDGATITDYVGDITLALGEGYRTPFGLTPNAAILSGTLTQTAVAGVATFNDLSIDEIGTGYTLEATSDDPANEVTRTSATFNITGTLVFTQQPTNADVDAVIAPAVTVTLRDGLGATVADYTGSITVRFAADGNPGGATLGGTLTQTAVAGVATFNDLTVNVADADYKLEAEAEAAAEAITTVESNTFDVGVFDLTSAEDTGTFGFFKDNYGPGLDLGAISPTTFLGSVVQQLTSDTTGGSTNTVFKVNGIFTQNAFTALTVDALGSLLAADATFGAGGGESTWIWDNQVRITAATSYTVAIG